MLIHRPHKQQGAVLVIVMMILSMLTLLTIHSMNNAVMNEKLVHNAKDSSIAFQAAESALKDARFFLNHLNDKPCDGDDCSAHKGVFKIGFAPKPGSPSWDEQARTFGEGTHAGLLALNLASQPQYVIEEVGKFDTVDNEGIYKITALGHGAAPGAQVVLEEFYRQPYNNVLKITGNSMMNMLMLSSDLGLSECFSLLKPGENCNGLFPTHLRPPIEGRATTVDIEFNGHMNGIFVGDLIADDDFRGLVGEMFGLMQNMMKGMMGQMGDYCNMSPVPKFMKSMCDMAENVGTVVVDTGADISKGIVDRVVPKGFTMSKLNINISGYRDNQNSLGNMMMLVDLGGDTRNICVSADGNMGNMLMSMDFGNGKSMADIMGILAKQVMGDFFGEMVGQMANMMQGMMSSMMGFMDNMMGTNMLAFFDKFMKLSGDKAEIEYADRYQINLGENGSFMNFIGMMDGGGDDTYAINTGQRKEDGISPNMGDMIMIMDMMGNDQYRINTHKGFDMVMLMDCTAGDPTPEVFKRIEFDMRSMGQAMKQMMETMMPRVGGTVGFLPDIMGNVADNLFGGMMDIMTDVMNKPFNRYIACPGPAPIADGFFSAMNPLAWAEWMLGFFPKADGEIFAAANQVAAPICSAGPRRLNWRQVF